MSNMPMNSMEGMDEGIYGDNDESSNDSKPQSVDEKEAEEATDLMSKSSFPGGCKVGDKYEIEITGDHGDQFSVKVVKPEDSDHPKGEPEDDVQKMNSEY